MYGCWLIQPSVIEVITFAAAEVSQLDDVIRHKDVLRFDVAMENFLAVHIFNSFEHIEHVVLDALHR